MSEYDDFLKTPEGNVLDYISTKYAGRPLPQSDLSEEERAWGREAIREIYEVMLEKRDFAEAVCDIAAKEMESPDVIAGNEAAIDRFAKKIALYSMLAVNTASDNASRDGISFSDVLGYSIDNVPGDYILPEGEIFKNNVKAGEYSYAAGVYDFVPQLMNGVDFTDKGMINDVMNDIRILSKTAISMVEREKQLVEIREKTMFYDSEKEKGKVLV